MTEWEKDETCISDDHSMVIRLGFELAGYPPLAVVPPRRVSRRAARFSLLLDTEVTGQYE